MVDAVSNDLGTVDDFFASASSSSGTCKFENINDFYVGVIESQKITQQQDFATKKPKFDDKGRAVNQLVLGLKTGLRDPQVADDDGSRALFVKGNLKYALADAVKAAGARKTEIGGVLKVTFTSTEDSGKGNPTKKYTCVYKPPADAVEQHIQESAPQAAQAQPVAQQAAPVQQQAAPAAQSQDVDAETAALLAQL